MNQETLINGQAFLCIKDVTYKTGDPSKKGTISFTKGQVYFVDKEHYLLDDRNIHKNYAWFKENFEKSPENDKPMAKKVFTGNTKKS